MAHTEVIWLLLCSLIFGIECSNNIYHAYKVDSLDNHVFNGSFFIEELENISSLLQCTLKCHSLVDCMSFGYNLVETKCRLYSTGFYETTDGMSVPGWRHYTFGDHRCPIGDGFHHARATRICFHLSPIKLNTTGARQYCKDRNSTLVSLNIIEKANNLSILMNIVYNVKGIGGIYIGLSKVGNQDWKWDNGNYLTYETEWLTGEPNCGGCTTSTNVFIKVASDWKWKAVVGDYEKSFICEVELE